MLSGKGLVSFIPSIFAVLLIAVALLSANAQDDDGEFERWLDETISSLEDATPNATEEAMKELHNKLPTLTGKHKEDAIAMLSAVRNHLKSVPFKDSELTKSIQERINGIDLLIQNLNESNLNPPTPLSMRIAITAVYTLVIIILGFLVGAYYRKRKGKKEAENGGNEEGEEGGGDIKDLDVVSKPDHLQRDISLPLIAISVIYITGCSPSTEMAIEEVVSLAEHYHGEAAHSHQGGKVPHTHDSNDKVVDALKERVSLLSDHIQSSRSEMTKHSKELLDLLERINRGDGSYEKEKKKLTQQLMQLENDVAALEKERATRKKQLNRAIQEAYRRGYQKGRSQ